MNAVMPIQRHAGLHAAFAAMRVATTRRHRNWMLAVYLTLLVAAALLGVFVPGDGARTLGLGFFAAIANFSLWAGWLARLLLLQRDAAGVQAPGIASAVRQALACGLALTVLLPGLVLLTLEVPVPVALGAPALGVLGGLLFALLPWPAAVLLLMAPGAWQWASLYLPPLGSAEMLAGAVVGLLVLTACWRSLLRGPDTEAIPAWRRPVMLQAPGGIVVWTDSEAGAASALPRMYEGWLAPMPRPTRAGPHAPGQAIDALLAGSMGYVAPRAAAKQWAIVAALVIAVIAIPFQGETPLLRDALLLGGVVGLLGGGWTLAMRLERQRNRMSAEFAELALLPGLGDAATASTRLLRRVAVRLGQLMLFALAGLGLLIWLRQMPWPYAAHLLAMLAGVGAGSVLMCVSALADRSVASTRMFLMMLPLILATSATLGMTLLRGPMAQHAVVWGLIWTLLTAAYLVAARSPLRRYRDRPHAFLLP
ncbi:MULTISPECIES: hypothetical protein [Luteimonas]|uniref:hypothetical protein n=1 Tax=Luteimonas TaxID=83614 RepID=UPI0011816831|nr:MULTISPECIES: hypothetical protein [Luteimonas]